MEKESRSAEKVGLDVMQEEETRRSETIPGDGCKKPAMADCVLTDLMFCVFSFLGERATVTPREAEGAAGGVAERKKQRGRRSA